ncbi:MAG: hypothetical protein ACM3SY_11680 [Candidatus Omnitrophota bacterium]
MVKKSAILLIFIFLWVQCSKSPDNGVDILELKDPVKKIPLKFELVQSTPIENLDYPTMYVNQNEIGVYGFVIKGKNGVGVCRFDHGFNPKEEIYFPFGQGPGDVGAGTRFYPIKGRLMSYDNTTKLFTYYDENLKYQKMQRGLKPINPFYFFKNGDYCVSSGWREKRNKEYKIINITKFPSLISKPIHEYGPVIYDEKRIIARDPGYDYFYSDKTGWVYVLNMAEYRLMAFDLNGKMVKQIKVKTKKIKISHEEQFKYVEEYLTSWGVRNHYRFCEIVQPASLMVPLDKGFVVIRRIDWRRHSESGFIDGDLFDYRLNLLGKVKIPEFYKCYYTANMLPSPHTSCYFNGYLYLIKETDDDYRLEKWKVVE